MKINLINGAYADTSPDFRTSYPRNYVPVPKATGISGGYIKPADGIEQVVSISTYGVDRGSVNWNGTEYRVMGTTLTKVGPQGQLGPIGDVGGSGQVTFTYSFDRLAIASNKKLYYYDGATLTVVTDPDLGVVLDVEFIDGYFMTTDGESLVVTDLTDPYSVNPLKYGSSELDPDPIKGVIDVRNEIYAVNRYTIEAFQNVGGSLFPFARVDGSQIMRGGIGTHAFCLFVESLAFLGSGRNESPAVYLAGPGTSQKISTREIDIVLQDYTEAQLALVVMEARVDKGHQHLWIHLPDQTLVFDGSATAELGEPIWFTLDSGVTTKSTYRARNLCWIYDEWRVGDPTSAQLGRLVDTVSSHYGQVIGWEFGTAMLYNESNGAIIHEMELVGLPGYVALGVDPVIWTSSSIDGTTWSPERPIKAGKRGQTILRLCWRKLGQMRNWRIQKFRGTSDARIPFARLEMRIEPLSS